MRLCWADKLAMLWAFVVQGTIFMAQNPGGWKVQFLTAPGLYTTLKLAAIVVLPVWIFLRLVDWLIGGPRRRRDEIRVYRC